MPSAIAEFLKPFLKGAPLVSYAYPYGKASLRTKKVMAPRFTSIRGVHPGLNKGRVDLAQLNAISLEMRCWDQDAIEAAIARVRHEHGWAVFYTHDVSETPSEYGSTPAHAGLGLVAAGGGAAGCLAGARSAAGGARRLALSFAEPTGSLSA